MTVLKTPEEDSLLTVKQAAPHLVSIPFLAASDERLKTIEGGSMN